MLEFDVGTFRAQATPGAEAIDVACNGECDLTALEPFGELLSSVHSQASESHGPVVLDLREVSFMNSSCLTKLVGWIAKIRELPEAARYHVRIRSNPSMPWQKRSLKAIQCFAADLVTIES